MEVLFNAEKNIRIYQKVSTLGSMGACLSSTSILLKLTKFGTRKFRSSAISSRTCGRSYLATICHDRSHSSKAFYRRSDCFMISRNLYVVYSASSDEVQKEMLRMRARHEGSGRAECRY